MQGDLTDPSYFDFISFAQLATISREIPLGQQAFEVGCCLYVSSAFVFQASPRVIAP